MREDAKDLAATVPERPRQAGELVVEFVDDGCLIFDPTSKRMHTLNHTAAVVLALCTGENDVAEIVRLVEVGFGTGPAAEAEVRACIATLFTEGLVG